MSDDDRDIDVESDDGEEFTIRQPVQRQTNGNHYYSQAEKRAHHNALERKRRDHIKDSFSSLRDTVPVLNGEKVASRAQILKRAADFITRMRNKTVKRQRRIEDLQYQNSLLESQINQLENVAGSSVDIDDEDLSSDESDTDTDSSEEDTSEEEISVQKKTKNVKTAHH